MEIMLDEANAHTSVKDLDFRFTVIAWLNNFILHLKCSFADGFALSCSPDGKFLVSVGSGDPGRVWDVTSSTPLVALSFENVSNNRN